jgi:hypothetical protein
VARVKSVPAIAKVDFEPRGKIHRLLGRRYTDITKIAGAIARWNVHATTQSHRKVCEIATHPALLGESVPCRARRPRVFVTEGQVLVHEIANGLDQRPPFGDIAKKRPSSLEQSIGFAISTTEEINEHVRGKVLKKVLAGIVAHLVWCSTIVDQKIR